MSSLHERSGNSTAVNAGSSADAKLAAGIEFAMDLIHRETLDPATADKLMVDSIQNWKDHINPGFLKYRKSVAGDQGFASIEWRDGEPGGATLIDASGKEYTDCLGGYGIYNVGHSNPTVIDAVIAQMKRQPLHSQELLDYLRGYAAQILSLTMPKDATLDVDGNELKYAFFTNSGTESVEAALKIAMMGTNRHRFLALQGCFHGKTLGSLAGTSKAAFRKPFLPFLGHFNHIPINDIDALRMSFRSAAFTGELFAGLIIEPIIGEGGIYVCSDEFLREARKLCTEYGTALIFDEVQSGMGRSGKFWACEHAGVAPDIMCAGKALGGGVLPVGACVFRGKLGANYFENPFLHTTTFGGNPLACSAAIAAISVLTKDKLIDQARDKGNYMMAKLRELQAKYPEILVDIRGRGLMLGIEFPDDNIGYKFSTSAFSQGVLIAGTLVNSRVIRLEPPLTIKYEQIDSVIRIFDATMGEIRSTLPAAVLRHPLPMTSTTAGHGKYIPVIHTGDEYDRDSIATSDASDNSSSEDASDRSASEVSSLSGNETDPDEHADMISHSVSIRSTVSADY